MQFHFEQIDQRAAARQHAVAFEQGLMLEDVEVEVLRQRIYEIFVRNGGRKFRLRPHALDGGREHRLEALPLMPQRNRFIGRNHLGDAFDVAP
jgi:hypothetical protein